MDPNGKFTVGPTAKAFELTQLTVSSCANTVVLQSSLPSETRLHGQGGRRGLADRWSSKISAGRFGKALGIGLPKGPDGGFLEIYVSHIGLCAGPLKANSRSLRLRTRIQEFHWILSTSARKKMHCTCPPILVMLAHVRIRPSCSLSSQHRRTQQLVLLCSDYSLWCFGALC